MIVYYFGADSAWSPEAQSEIRRRNMAILSAISNQSSVTKVYNVIRSTRSVVLGNRNKAHNTEEKIFNLYIAPIVPERGFLKQFARPINQWLLKKIYSKEFSSSNSEKKLGWCYWPKGFLDFEYMDLDMDMVFDTDHNIINEPNNEKADSEAREKLLLQAGKRAKYILSSSRSMLDWYNKKGLLNTKILMNGVTWQRVNLNPLAHKNNTYTVTYCGTLSKWIKTDWLFKVIQEHPEWHFNFIGTNYKTNIDAELAKFSNVTLLGFLEPKEVDHIIKQSDVCFGLYQKDNALDVNSMKLYDYLAQMVPVVVNDYHAYLNEDFNTLLNIARSYEEFEKLLANPLKNNRNELNQFLYSSTWNQRVKNIFNDIVT